MPDINIAADGIDKLHNGLSPHKAAEPDKFKPIDKYQTFGKKHMFPQFTKKGKQSDLANLNDVCPVQNSGACCCF